MRRMEMSQYILKMELKRARSEEGGRERLLIENIKNKGFCLGW